MTGRAGNFAAGVSACTAEIEVGDGSAVVRPSHEGPSFKHLVRRHIEMPDISVGKSHPPSDVERSKE